MADSSITTYEKLDGLAKWFGTGVAAAFFASLERCSCVNLTTYDTDDEDEEEAKDRPLMLTNLQQFYEDSSVSSATTATTATTATAIANNNINHNHATSVDNLPV